MKDLIKESPFLEKEIILENESSFSISDGFAISKGHTLVIPRREVSSIFDLNDKEYFDCFSLVKEIKNKILKEYSPDGFNIGINDGFYAGQTIQHAHIHIIPRYKDDIDNPRGGVRNILIDNTGYKENIIQVVAGIIEKNQKILIAKRAKGKDLEGLWEYAGGKVEQDETDEESLKRELKEEFEIDVIVEKYLTESLFSYPKKTINLKAFKVKYVAGDFKLNDHEEIKWVSISELKNFKFAPADIPINNYLLKNGL